MRARGQVVPQAVDPVPVDSRHPAAHGTTAAYGLRKSSGSSSEAHASIPLSPQPKRKSSAFLAEGVGILRGSGGSSVRGAGVGREPDRALTKMVKRR